MSDVKFLSHKQKRIGDYLFIEVVANSHNQSFHTSKDGCIYYGCDAFSSWVQINGTFTGDTILGLAHLLPTSRIKNIWSDEIEFEKCNTLIVKLQNQTA